MRNTISLPSSLLPSLPPVFPQARLQWLEALASNTDIARLTFTLDELKLHHTHAAGAAGGQGAHGRPGAAGAGGEAETGRGMVLGAGA